MPDSAPPLLELVDCTVRYPGAAQPALAIPGLTLAIGERVLLAGPTGAGKSTLLMLLLGLLGGEGMTVTGTAHVFGAPLAGMNPATIGARVGVVFQSPQDQCLTAQVSEEIALGLRALGIPETDIPAKVAAALEQVGLSDYADHPPALLSGGQQQRLALACALAREPEVLILDEPFSQLDPAGAAELAALLNTLTRTRRMGLVIAEHRHALALACVDRVLAIEAGEVTFDGPAARLLAALPELPPIRPDDPNELPPTAAALCTLAHLEVRYAELARPALQLAELTLPERSPIALLGANGSGKSTLLACLAGLQRPTAGTLTWAAGHPPKIAYVPQVPEWRLLGRTIAADCALTGATPAAIAAMAAALELPAGDLPPLAASRGQRLQIALATALLEAPDLLLLDEPTTGQDAAHIAAITEVLAQQRCQVLFATHDLTLAGSFARWIVILHEGELLAQGTPAALLNNRELLRRASLLVEGDPPDG